MIKAMLLLLAVALSGCGVRPTVTFDVKSTTGEVITFVCPADSGAGVVLYITATQCFVRVGGAK